MLNDMKRKNMYFFEGVRFILDFFLQTYILGLSESNDMHIEK